MDMDMKLKEKNIKKLLTPTPFLIMYPIGFILVIRYALNEWRTMYMLPIIIYSIISALCILFERVFAIASKVPLKKVFIIEFLIIIVLLYLFNTIICH